MYDSPIHSHTDLHTRMRMYVRMHSNLSILTYMPQRTARMYDIVEDENRVLGTKRLPSSPFCSTHGVAWG